MGLANVIARLRPDAHRNCPTTSANLSNLSPGRERSREVLRGSGPTSHAASALQDNDFQREVRGSRGFSLLCAYGREEGVIGKECAHIYKKTGENLSDLSGQPTTGGRTSTYGPRGRAESSQNLSRPLTAPVPATILRHCRCSDCLNFSKVGGEYFCSEYIGGTAVVWATGERFCDPPSDAWHYCALYRGPQISKDVFVWPKTSAGAKEGPAPGGGGPSGGPVWPEPVSEDRSNHHHCSTPTPGSSASNAPATPRAAQVGAGSNISGEGDGEPDRAQIVRQMRMCEC